MRPLNAPLVFFTVWHLLPVAGAHFSQTRGCQKGLNKICQSKYKQLYAGKRNNSNSWQPLQDLQKLDFLLLTGVKRWYDCD